jgi:hypothetical protein
MRAVLATALIIATLGGCSSDDGNEGDIPPLAGESPASKYCSDAATLQQGGEYYAQNAQCLANTPPNKAALLTVLDKYVDDPTEMAALADAVCMGPSRPDCLKGAFSLSSEVTGLRNGTCQRKWDTGLDYLV